MELCNDGQSDERSISATLALIKLWSKKSVEFLNRWMTMKQRSGASKVMNGFIWVKDSCVPQPMARIMGSMSPVTESNCGQQFHMKKSMALSIIAFAPSVPSSIRPLVHFSIPSELLTTPSCFILQRFAESISIGSIFSNLARDPEDVIGS
jgi:hypothetical protein